MPSRRAIALLEFSPKIGWLTFHFGVFSFTCMVRRSSIGAGRGSAMSLGESLDARGSCLGVLVSCTQVGDENEDFWPPSKFYPRRQALKATRMLGNLAV